MRLLFPLQLAVPAGTTQAAPVSQTWVLYPGWVHGFRIEIPAGHNRLTGVRITYQGTPIVPFHRSLWVVGNGRPYDVTYEREVMQTGLVVQGFNTDQYAHTFYLYADVDPEIGHHRLAVADHHHARARHAAVTAAVGGLASPGPGGHR